MKCKSRNTPFFLGLIVLFIFSSCAKYKAQPLAHPKTNTLHNKKSTISLTYRVFDKKDCKQYLDRNVIIKGYQPIQITLTNHTKRYFNFSKAMINVPCVPASTVAKKVHTLTVARAAGYGIAGLIIWPLVIPAIVDGVGSSQANTKLDADFVKKELADQVLSPFNTISGLIFVPIDKYKSHIEITLIDAENHAPIKT